MPSNTTDIRTIIRAHYRSYPLFSEDWAIIRCTDLAESKEHWLQRIREHLNVDSGVKVSQVNPALWRHLKGDENEAGKSKSVWHHVRRQARRMVISSNRRARSSTPISSPVQRSMSLPQTPPEAVAAKRSSSHRSGMIPEHDDFSFASVPNSPTIPIPRTAVLVIPPTGLTIETFKDSMKHRMRPQWCVRCWDTSSGDIQNWAEDITAAQIAEDFGDVFWMDLEEPRSKRECVYHEWVRVLFGGATRTQHLGFADGSKDRWNWGSAYPT